MKKQQGITLIALVITIIVLLILAGVSISMVIGNNGILNQASTADRDTRRGTEKEQVQMAFIAAKMKQLRGEIKKIDATALATELKEFGLVEGIDFSVTGTNPNFNVKFLKSQNEYPIENEIVKANYNDEVGTPEKVTIPEGLAEGDEVTYSPSGSYTWQVKYATSDDSIPDITLSSATGGDFNISTWKVLSINEETGKVELVPSAATTGDVKLQGAQGYNNGVKLLNDACSNLYGNASKGITARSINMDDIENLYDGDFVEYYQTNYPPSSFGLGENYQATSAYETANSKYPTIYAQEELSVINGNKKAEGTGLGISEQSNFIERTDGGATGGIVSTATSIQPYATYRSCYSLTDLLGSGDGNLLKVGGAYWVASRWIESNDNNCSYGVSYVTGNMLSISIGGMCGSAGYESGFSISLFPVVSLSSELLNSGSTTEWAVK